MGLIRSAVSAAGSVLQDQWKEYFYCDALPDDVLVAKGKKKASGFSGNSGRDDIITSGSGIAVADGQCMIIVEDGKVVEFCAEPGLFTWDASSEPSLFNGVLKESIKQTFEAIGKRFTYGGVTAKNQFVYYFNTKELLDNKFGTPNPIPFAIVDPNIGLNLETAVRCSGIYSYRIIDPLLFYTNVAGNVGSYYTKDMLDNQLKTEFISALAPAMGELSKLGLKPSQLSLHTMELCDAMNSALSAKWSEQRGIEVVSIALNPVTIPEEDAAMIKQKQFAATNRTEGMAAATLIEAKKDAMIAAANNQGGAMNAFMGMNMAGAMTGMNDGDLIAAAQVSPQAQVHPAPAAPGEEVPATPMNAQAAEGRWFCPNCGKENYGNFCPNCGTPKPNM